MPTTRRWVALAAAVASLFATAVTLAVPNSVYQASGDREGNAIATGLRPTIARTRWTLCQDVLRRTPTLRLPAGTSKECVSSLPGGRIGRATLSGGVYRVQIVASTNVSLMTHTMQHESAHLYEFSRPSVSYYVSKALKRPFFGAYAYNNQPQEIWAESVATCRHRRDRSIRIAPLLTCTQVNNIVRSTGG